jgi:hypothetical protein
MQWQCVPVELPPVYRVHSVMAAMALHARLSMVEAVA